MTFKDMEKIWCSFCYNSFISSDSYKHHMKTNHPGFPLQKINLLDKKSKFPQPKPVNTRSFKK